MGGGWSEAVLAHESMLPPAHGLAPERAVLAEPAAVALHPDLHPDLDVTAVCAGRFGAERALGEVAALTGARALRPRIGRLPVLDGGVDAVFDCVAAAATVDLGLRLLRARGTYVMVGTAARAAVDWSLVWWRELSVLATAVAGPAAGAVKVTLAP